MWKPRGAVTSKAASDASWASGASRNISTSNRCTSTCQSNQSDGIEETTMNYYSGKEMAAAFRTVRGNTIKIAEEVPETKYDFKPAPDCRSIGQTLVHIALGSGFQAHIHQNKVNDLKTVNFPELFQKMVTEEGKPRNKAETIALLKSEGDKFASFLEGLNESFLS